jgi:rSAM/selenodomain-associated transferase 1
MSVANGLIIFIKTPVPGNVKTRLQPHISKQDSARLYGAILKDIDERFTKMKHIDCYYAVAPEEFDTRILQKYVSFSRHIVQNGADLGERMANAFNQLFSRGYKKGVLIGSDIPGLSAAILKDAFNLLELVDCVIGPGIDDGYYLIGMKKLYPMLFKGISWSTSKVLDNTIDIAKKNDISVKLLVRLRDIDTIVELKELYIELKREDQDSADFPENTWKVLSTLKI